jgi:hypothetical protein
VVEGSDRTSGGRQVPPRPPTEVLLDRSTSNDNYRADCHPSFAPHGPFVRHRGPLQLLRATAAARSTPVPARVTSATCPEIFNAVRDHSAKVRSGRAEWSRSLVQGTLNRSRDPIGLPGDGVYASRCSQRSPFLYRVGHVSIQSERQLCAVVFMRRVA